VNDKLYYPQLDGLRFLAFVAVFIHHAPNPPIPNYEAFRIHTWAGVDIFLCLSAFLFVHLLGAEWRQTGTIHVTNFYIRRGLRIWPVYFLYIAIVVVVTGLGQGFSDSSLQRILSSATFTANILDALSDYAYAYPMALLLHLWTISYEEQFYLFIPWFLRLIFRNTKKGQLMILGLVCGVGLAIRAGFIYLDIPFPAVYVLPITHFESVLLGLVIGLGLFQSLFNRIAWWAAGLLAGVSFYLVSLLPYYRENTVWLMFTYILVGLGSACLLLMALKSRDVPAMRWLSSKPLVYLGKISYGLYLYHYACLYLCKWLINTALKPFAIPAGPAAVLIFSLAFGMTILFASFSYRFVEKPFLRMKAKYTSVAARPI
jgi:peptidoglycan/LPS O-acetylase OafA/YrhL